MRFGVLGALELGPGVPVPGARSRALLAHLLVEPGRSVPADRLADLLWGDDQPRDPRNTLQTRVSALRGVLEAAEPGGRALLRYDAAGYRLEGADVDAARFRTLVAAAPGTPAARRTALTDALALWRGPAFGDVVDDPDAAPRGASRLAAAAAALEDERLAAVEDLADIRLALGEHAAVATDLAAEVARRPTRERLRAAHLRALAGSGRQAEALAGFDALRVHLAEELGVDPGPELVALHRDLLDQDPELLAPAHRSLAGDLPTPAGAIVGRDDEVARVRELVAAHRAVTLTGPGGVGKTRLALAVAHAVAPTVADGARLVELAAAPAGSDVETLAALVLRTLGLRAVTGPSAAVEGLRDRELLLVLDNGEHVVDALATLVGALLAAAPGVRVLVTSQESLAVGAEVVVPVAPLPAPAAEGDLDALTAASPAARLFVERTRAAGADLSAGTPETAALVADVCRRLDGLPLALELAAARVRGLGLQVVAAGTDDRFRVLARGRRDAPARHRSLAATFDWAWTLLHADERAALRRLAVVAGGAAPDAAVAVVGAEPPAGPADPVAVLGRLVERSWIDLDDAPDGGRYRLLASVRAYAAERLAEAGEATAARRRHAAHYAALAERAAAGVRTADAPAHLAVLHAEDANLRAAHAAAAAAGDAEVAARLVEALAWPWWLAGRHRDVLALARATPAEALPASARRRVREWADIAALMAHQTPPTGAPDPGEPDAADARRAAVLAHAMVHFAEPGAARAAVDRADTLARATGEPWAAATVATVRAVDALMSGDLVRAADLATHARTATPERWVRVHATGVLAQLALVRGDHVVADALHEAALADARILALWPDVVAQLAGRGRVALLRGDLDAADTWHGEAQRLAREHGDRPGQEHAAIGLGLAARRRGDLDAAETHLATWLDWNRGLGAGHGVALIASQLGFVAEQRGHADRARRLHTEAHDAAVRAGDPRARALALEGLAGAAALAGDPGEARALLDEAAALRHAVGAPVPDAERGDVSRIEADLALRSAVPPRSAQDAAPRLP